MACLSEKLSIGIALAGMVAAGALATATAETVVVAAGAIGAFLVAGAAYVKSCYDLAICLNNADRPDDAAKIREHADSVQRDLDALRQKCGL